MFLPFFVTLIKENVSEGIHIMNKLSHLWGEI